MRLLRFTFLLLVIAVAALVAAQDGQPFRLVFANTNLSSVLRAVGLKTGANIVYVGKDDPNVTVNVTAGNADEALRFVTTAASMTYRRVGQTFIVAKSEDMRQALEPFGLHYRLTLSKTTAADISGLLRNALPYLTVQPVGTDQVLLTGTKEDIEQAKAIVAQQESAAETMRAVTAIVPVRTIDTTKLVGALAELYPDVRFRAVPQGAIGGNLIVTGVQSRIDDARMTISTLDSTTPLPGAEETFTSYEIRYSSAPILIDFLKQAMPDVQAIAGPDHYTPSTPLFSPLSSTSSTITGGSTSSQGSGTSQTSGTQKDASNLPSIVGGVGGALSSTENRRMPGEIAKVIILRGQKSRVDQAVAMLTSVDVKPKQVSIEVKVVDYSPSDSSNIGFSWNWTRFGFYEGAPGSSVSMDPGAEPTDFNTTKAGFGVFSRVPFTFTSILNALVTKREAKILATPSVQVIDNENANIFIGDTVRARISQAGALGAQNVQIVEFPIGIILLIRPRVNADGDVTMRVHPVVSTITSVDDENIPQTSTREAETTLVCKNGETVVLGGLIRDEMTKTVREVPFLSQLPLVGELFRNTSRTGRKSEILVFITPKIDNGGSAK